MQILSELATCVGAVPNVTLQQTMALIDLAPRVFVYGAGRSGLCMRAFAMRLMHLGKSVFVIGETTTPGLLAGDLLILGSGSGRTPTLLAMAESAKRQDATLLLFTTDAAAPLADLADHLVVVPAPSLRSASGSAAGPISIQPMGSLFEQALLILGDRLVLALMERNGIEPTTMLERHANVE